MKYIFDDNDILKEVKTVKEAKKSSYKTFFVLLGGLWIVAVGCLVYDCIKAKTIITDGIIIVSGFTFFFFIVFLMIFNADIRLTFDSEKLTLHKRFKSLSIKYCDLKTVCMIPTQAAGNISSRGSLRTDVIYFTTKEDLQPKKVPNLIRHKIFSTEGGIVGDYLAFIVVFKRTTDVYSGEVFGFCKEAIQHRYPNNDIVYKKECPSETKYW